MNSIDVADVRKKKKKNLLDKKLKHKMLSDQPPPGIGNTFSLDSLIT